MTWSRDQFIRQLDSTLESKGLGQPESESVEIKVALTESEIRSLQRDIRVAACVDEEAGPWSSSVLSDEQNTAAVVAMIASRVDERVRIREARHQMRTNILTGFAALLVTVLFAVVGWMAKATLQENVDRRLDAAQDEFDRRVSRVETTIPGLVQGEVDGATKSLQSDTEAAVLDTIMQNLPMQVEEEVASQTELDRFFLEALILGVQFDLGESFSNSDRDQMMQFLERVHGENSVVGRDSFSSLLQKTVLSFAASSNRVQVDRIYELYPAICTTRTGIAVILLQDYALRLIGSPLGPHLWNTEDAKKFDDIAHSMPSAYEPEVLCLRLLIEARGSGAQTDTAAEILDAAMSMRGDGESDDPRHDFLSFLIGYAHPSFIARSQSRDALQTAEVVVDVVSTHRDQLYAMSDGVDPELIGKILSGKLNEMIKKGRYTSDEIPHVVQDLLDVFPGRADVRKWLGAPADG